MKKDNLHFCVLAVIFLVFILLSLRVEAMRVNGGLILEGDSVYEVYKKAGEPDGTSGNATWRSADKLYYDDGNGGTYEITIDNGDVADIDWNRN